MKKIYIQPELTFEPIECEEGINNLSTQGESKGPGNTSGAPGTTTSGDGTGVNDDEIGGDGNSLNLGFSFE